MHPIGLKSKGLVCAASAAVLMGLSSGCAYNVQFPSGQVRFDSNGLSVGIDASGRTSTSVLVDLPFIEVDVRT